VAAEIRTDSLVVGEPASYRTHGVRRERRTDVEHTGPGPAVAAVETRSGEPLVNRRQLLGYAGAATALAWLPGCSADDAEPSPSLAGFRTIVGNPRPDGFTVSTRTNGPTRVRVMVARERGLKDGAVRSPPVVPDAAGWASVTVTGLEPGTEYYYDVELTDPSGSRLAGSVGRGKTLPTPGTPASFSFAFGSCMESGATNRSVMDCILDREPLLFLHLGDFGYFDNDSKSVDSHRSDFESQLSANAALRQVLAQIPTFYVQSDHDGGGGNNAGRGKWTKPNRAAYRQVFPHPDLEDHEDGLYWSVVVGRVRLIFTDHKTYCSPAKKRDGPSKSMMGTAQKKWFKSEMRKREPVKIWVQHSPFINAEADGDSWGNYATEQEEIATFLRQRAKGEVVTVHGDMHAVAVSTDNPWGLRSWSAAPFEQTSSHKGGPWTSGPIPAADKKSTRQYGYVEVTDSGDRIDVEFTGYDSNDKPLVSDALSVTDLTAATGT
jgi:phosphodiesterase/alkaline phosphatase D-like protein